MPEKSLPLSWGVLRKRVGKCLKCGRQATLESWALGLFPQFIQCPKCGWYLELAGALEGVKPLTGK